MPRHHLNDIIDMLSWNKRSLLTIVRQSVRSLTLFGSNHLFIFAFCLCIATALNMMSIIVKSILDNLQSMTQRSCNVSSALPGINTRRKLMDADLLRLAVTHDNTVNGKIIGRTRVI